MPAFGRIPREAPGARRIPSRKATCYFESRFPSAWRFFLWGIGVKQDDGEKIFTAVFDAGEVAAIAGIDYLKMIANWTDRGLVDPYHPPQASKPGRGRARQYAFRDVLTFALMKDLAERYEIPIPLGRRICAVVVEDLAPARVGYVVVVNVRENRVSIRFFKNSEELARHMASDLMESRLVIDTAALLNQVRSRAMQILADRASPAVQPRAARASKRHRAPARP
jgi:hypothetical protein